MTLCLVGSGLGKSEDCKLQLFTAVMHNTHTFSVNYSICDLVTVSLVRIGK